ncbi:MAG: hypothetical protein V4710_22910, partial [Verrucomicrobiota bacterium]
EQETPEQVARTLEVNLLELRISGEADLEKIWNMEWREHALERALEVVRVKVKPLLFQIFQLHVLKGISAQEVAKRLGVKLMQVYWAKLRVGLVLKAALEAVEKEG